MIDDLTSVITLKPALMGIGRINDNQPIDLKEYIIPCGNRKAQPLAIPTSLKKISFSKTVGKTIYDVNAMFDVDGKRSVLEQFKELILRQKANSHI